ncbi:hypothetical protein WDU94_006364, partial [Cyamophila willieti]
MDPRNVPLVDEQLTYSLIQDIRNKADISYDKSKLVLGVVLSQLETILPDASSRDFVSQLLTYFPQSEHVDVKVLDSTEDSVVLTDVLNKLIEIKEDAQQRSWQLHEDEHIILNLVETLRALLTDADSAICNRVLARDGYSAMEALVAYYQMEPRWSIRQVLLEVFVICCGLHPLLITSLLNSVLPQELGRDVRSSYISTQERVPQSTLLLTCLFSMGEPMPLSHLDQLGSEFICFILDCIEKNETDEDETLSDLFLSFLLGYNLQFTPGMGSNVVLECLQNRSSANVFTSKLLLMFNRE